MTKHAKPPLPDRAYVHIKNPKTGEAKHVVFYNASFADVLQHVERFGTDETARYETIEAALKYLDDRADTVDGPEGQPVANDAMALAEALRRVTGAEAI